MPKNIPLKIAFIESGKSQADVAAEIGIHNTKLSLIVNGRRSPSEFERKAIARVLKRKVAELFPEQEARAS